MLRRPVRLRVHPETNPPGAARPMDRTERSERTEAAEACSFAFLASRGVMILTIEFMGAMAAVVLLIEGGVLGTLAQLALQRSAQVLLSRALDSPLQRPSLLFIAIHDSAPEINPASPPRIPRMLTNAMRNIRK